jgi:hypothetical protein
VTVSRTSIKTFLHQDPPPRTRQYRRPTARSRSANAIILARLTSSRGRIPDPGVEERRAVADLFPETVGGRRRRAANRCRDHRWVVKAMASWKPPSRRKQSSALGTALQMNAATRVAESWLLDHA